MNDSKKLQAIAAFAAKLHDLTPLLGALDEMLGTKTSSNQKARIFFYRRKISLSEFSTISESLAKVETFLRIRSVYQLCHPPFLTSTLSSFRSKSIRKRRKARKITKTSALDLPPAKEPHQRMRLRLHVSSSSTTKPRRRYANLAIYAVYWLNKCVSLLNLFRCNKI